MIYTRLFYRLGQTISCLVLNQSSEYPSATFYHPKSLDQSIYQNSRMKPCFIYSTLVQERRANYLLAVSLPKGTDCIWKVAIHVLVHKTVETGFQVKLHDDHCLAGICMLHLHNYLGRLLLINFAFCCPASKYTRWLTPVRCFSGVLSGIRT